MIFDADTHITPYRYTDISITGDELVERLNRQGVDHALCWLSPQGVDNVSDSNRFIYDNAKKHASIVPFGWANVREGLQKALRDAEQCISEFGFVGVKLNGAQNEYPIDSPDALTVCKRIAGLGGIIAFHIGVDAPDNTSPARASVVAGMFPDTPIIMVHMGGAGDGSTNCADAVIEAAEKHPNMFLTGSAIAMDKVKLAIDRLGADRVMFGSDEPYSDLSERLEEYRVMLQDYDDDIRQKVMGGTAKKLFMPKG